MNPAKGARRRHARSLDFKLVSWQDVLDALDFAPPAVAGEPPDVDDAASGKCAAHETSARPGSERFPGCIRRTRRRKTPRRLRGDS